jgi:hypothetical protein
MPAPTASHRVWIGTWVGLHEAPGAIGVPGPSRLRSDATSEGPADPAVPEGGEGPAQSLVTRTAVPYAQISVQTSPISEVSKRIARMAFAPRRSASSTIRFMTSLRLS